MTSDYLAELSALPQTGIADIEAEEDGRMELIWTETPGERGKEAEQRDSRGSRGGRSAGGTKIYTLHSGDPKQSNRGPLSRLGGTNKRD